MSDTGQEEGGGDVVVYELDDWTSEQRGALETRLAAEGIEHQWEMPEGVDAEDSLEGGPVWQDATDLVVGERDEAAVDSLLDEIEFPDELEAVDDDGEADEAIYSVMSNLYVAVDKLKDDPADMAQVGEFFDAADAATKIEAPFGIDEIEWAQIQSMARNISAALENEADDDAVKAQAQELRDILFRYV
jgi:hypothetical protein